MRTTLVVLHPLLLLLMRTASSGPRQLRTPWHLDAKRALAAPVHTKRKTLTSSFHLLVKGADAQGEGLVE